MPLPSPQTKDEWISLAQTRLLNVLRVRHAATMRQLEVKVCESGPPDKRPQPHILLLARRALLESRKIRPVAAPGERSEPDAVFYTLPHLYPQPAMARIQELLVDYRVHRLLADKKEYCSNVLEEIVRASFKTVPQYTYLGLLPTGSPLDGVYQFGPLRIGLEVKNSREWVYPMSGRIWEMVRKCLELDAIPLLVPRKIGYITRSIFSRVGILGFEFHRQVFSPLVAHLLDRIQHKDALGYKDVIALPPNPHPPLVNFLAKTLPAQTDRYKRLWDDHRDLLREFAIERNLGDRQMRDRERQAHYHDLAQHLFYEGREEEEDAGFHEEFY